MPPTPTPLWHALSSSQVVASIDSDVAVGLTTDEVAARRARVGANRLPEVARRSLARVIAGQFASPLIYLLCVAAAIAVALDHRSDALVIVVVVVLNAIIGALQEGRAERSLAALRRLEVHRTRVIRGGAEALVEAWELVPGDVIVLDAGDAVPADARVLDHAALQIAEAALTGESLPVAKDVVALAADTPLADRASMVYAGTHVTAGRARAVVVATGSATELGRIAGSAATATDAATPLERRIARFGRYVVIAAAVLFALVLAVGLARGVPLGQVVMLGISQVVGIIPEGLPVAMTIALAVGVQRMARRRAVVRRLSAVETLGSTTIICTDKTGTLTKNEMTVVALALPDGRRFALTGAGYEPRGELEADGAVVAAVPAEVRALVEAATLCNDATLRGPRDLAPRWQPIGDPTEVALVVAAIKLGVVPDALRARHPRRAELPFDPAAKLMATQHAGDPQAGAPIDRVIVKGAPEALLPLCAAVRGPDGDEPLTAALRAQLEATSDELATRALRVLAVGVVEGGDLDGRLGFAGLAGRVTLLGLFGQIDPPRPEVAEAVARCRRAGIRPVMVTGDHKATGAAIARELGIAGPDDRVVDGRELEAMSDAELAADLDRIAVFARVHPAQKLRIVGAYQARGEVVAMTGDGVNDAPALVAADVGVAMGQTGTEVAKEASKIVVGDDNFATIVAAVEEGRVVYRNIKKAVLLLVSTSAAEVLVLLLALIAGYPPPFAAVQILWNNLVTEGLVTVNLIMEPAEGDEMTRPPIASDEPLLTRVLLTRMAVMVPTIVSVTLGWFILRLEAGVPPPQVTTETFTLLAICEWWNVLNCRSETHSAFHRGGLANHWLIGGLILGNLLQVAVVFWSPLGRVFHTVPFGWREAVALGVVGSLVLWVEELRKWLVRRRAGITS
jgi:magnesium-transporting ATPase (P-type)